MNSGRRALPHYRYWLLGAFAVFGNRIRCGALGGGGAQFLLGRRLQRLPTRRLFTALGNQNLAQQQTFYLAALRSVLLALTATAVAMVVGTMGCLCDRALPAALGERDAGLLPVANRAAKHRAWRCHVHVPSSARACTEPISVWWSPMLVVVLPFVIVVLTAALANYDLDSAGSREWISVHGPSAPS